MTVLVEYEPVNPLANKELFKQYLSATLTRIIRRDKPVSAFENPYIDSLRILTDRIIKFNAKFIRDKSGLRLARVVQFTLKMVKYAPREKRGWQPLPEFLAKTRGNINIQNNDSAVSDTRYFIFLNGQISQEPTAFERLVTTTICFRIIILIHSLTQYHPTMFVSTKITDK